MGAVPAGNTSPLTVCWRSVQFFPHSMRKQFQGDHVHRKVKSLACINYVFFSGVLLYSSWGAGKTNLISIQGHSCNCILKLQEQNCIVGSFLDHKWIPSSEGNSSFHSISTNSTSKKSLAFGGILLAHVKEALKKINPPHSYYINQS